MKTYLGVIDRLEGGKATILIESEGKEFVIDVKELPNGSREGSWLQLQLGGENITQMVIDHEKTEEMNEKVHQQMNRIRSKSKGSKFRRK